MDTTHAFCVIPFKGGFELVMKTVTPPLGLLEFLERVSSNAKIYEVEADADQLSVSLGCCEDDILTCSLLLHADRAPRIAIQPWNQQPTLDSGERKANDMQVYLLTGYQSQWLPPFGLPHLLHTTLDPACFDSPCLYVPAGVFHGWMAITPNELKSLTDFDRWSREFVA
jgi:prolyl-tRNA editing enzyme YbaK/EbsC (Cys-tRNA(Pro) deacylase)